MPVDEADQASWRRSLGALFGEGMFAAVGARRRDDWRLDALDVMRLRTDDPRNWPKRRMAPGGCDYGTGPDNPFIAVTPGDFDRSFPVSRRGAEQIMVTLQGEWFRVADIPGFAEREAELTAHAVRVLGRFGRDALFFTNVSAAREDPHADMFGHGGAYEGFTGHVIDCGVIAVSSTEVGIFWSFTVD
ncbi:hypothetical protein [Streptomyces pratensis]|uniref:hypothetical protein n=1 Tax=Streptomyces pratensis TaxID=1169025 RepID=UPI003633DBFD